MTHRQRTAGRLLAPLLAVALVLQGCASDGGQSIDDTEHEVTLEYQIGDTHVLLEVQLTLDGLAYEGTSTVTRNGEQRVAFARFPATEVEPVDGKTAIEFEGTDGVSFRYTEKGDSPFVVCGGVCIAALVAAAACTGYVLYVITSCWWNDGCWTYSLYLCSGSCDETWES